MIYVVMQGPASSSIIRMIKQFKNYDIKFCVATYPNISLKKIENPNIIYLDFPILYDTPYIRAKKAHNALGVIFGQIYSTFKGCQFLKDHYNPNDEDILIKCRTDEEWNVSKFLSLIEKDSNFFYNIDYMNDIFSISDHLFATNFSTIYKAFKQMMRYIDDPNVYTEDIAPLHIEAIIWAYIKHNSSKELTKKVIGLKEIFPCIFRRNTIGTFSQIDENGISNIVEENLNPYRKQTEYFLEDLRIGNTDVAIFNPIPYMEERKISQPIKRNLNI